MGQLVLISLTTALILICIATAASARVAFEKLTDFDFPGTTYYSVKNLSLYECQGWCREEQDCVAASFSFVLNPLTPAQETLCQLQNDSSAHNPKGVAQRANSLYYMVKLQLRSENVCMRPWSFERVPNKIIRGLDNALIYTSTKEACLSACLNEKRFICRSVEYDYNNMKCVLSDSDRRSTGQFVQLVDSQGTDYFENLCLKPNQACKYSRVYQSSRTGVADDKVAQYVGLHYYTDKELQVTSEAACRLACEIETEFLCRSFLYLGVPQGAQYNCRLYHLDHKSLPDGPSTFLNGERPLIDVGEPTGQYFENYCEKTPPANTEQSLPIVFDATEDPTLNNLTRSDVNCDKTGTCYDVAVHCKDTRIAVSVRTNKPFNGRIYALGRSETCNIDVINSDSFRLDLTMTGQDCNTASATGVYTNTVVLQHHTKVMTKADKIYKVKCTYDMSSKNITFGMMPIRDPEMIHINSSPEAPPPRIRILDARQREVETVRIGDRLTFRIEIPEDTPYGIFARSCVAMAKDSKSTFQIIDDDGCPVDPTIFPSFTPDGNALQSLYEAFRFTESYGVIFQCNVKYCLGPCEPAVCEWGRDSVESWGRRRRSVANNETIEEEDEMNISQEILVLDFGDEKNHDFLRSDPSTDFGRARSNDKLDNHLAGEPLQQQGINCDPRGNCYNVKVLCKDKFIDVAVQSLNPFNGRIYTLGRSETCNQDIRNTSRFNLNVSLMGKDCNTQSASSEYTNTVVLQRNAKILTKSDQLYRIKCSYDVTPKNILFGMFPILNPDTVSIEQTVEAPTTTIRIVDNNNKEIETAKIGDRLIFRVEVPLDSPYGIFAYSCYAMAKDSASTFQIIDDNGCPVDTDIFPAFQHGDHALSASYEAFRFTESYGVIFQCNVRYCLGPCPPADCSGERVVVAETTSVPIQEVNNDIDLDLNRTMSEPERSLHISWGRRRRAIRSSEEEYTDEVEEEFNVSTEIIVLDL